MNQYYGAYPPQSLTPQQAAALEARKHYTESHTAMDKAEMERRASEHLTSAMSTIRTIYGDADPDLRKKIKADFTKLVADMPA